VIDHPDFLERCCDGLDGVAVSEGAFSPGPAIWVGRRELAHFDADDTLDVRLTWRLISERRAELRSDVPVALRPGSSDWIDVTIANESDRSFAVGSLVRRRHRPTGDRSEPVDRSNGPSTDGC